MGFYNLLDLLFNHSIIQSFNHSIFQSFYHSIIQSLIFRFDSTFDGFLTVVFEAYRLKSDPIDIQRPEGGQNALFSPVVTVATNTRLAYRVWAGLCKKLSVEARQNIFQTFLSELPRIEMLLFKYIKLVLGSDECMEQNFADPHVLEVIKTGRRVWREKHRMEAFVRFRKMADGTFLSVIEPDFNVLPLISAHFETRYADQKWVIFDRKRHYGLYYDLEKVEEIHFGFEDLSRKSQSLPKLDLDPEEEQFQALWQRYFSSVNIPERKNPKLHLRHIPKRYWRYLSEKQAPSENPVAFLPKPKK